MTEVDFPLSSYSDISDTELDGVMELLVCDFRDKHTLLNH